MDANDALSQLVAQTSACPTGCDLSTNLQTPGYEERPCFNLTPFFTRWCKTHNKGMGYEGGSFVFDDCGYYFTLQHETRSPRDAKSTWIQFTGLSFALMFATFLRDTGCEQPATGIKVPAVSTAGCNGDSTCS